MSTEEKVGFVRSARSVFGLMLALKAVGLSRSTWYYHEVYRRSYGEKYGHVRVFLERIARKHAEYGYRRATDELRDVYDVRVGRKVVQRLNRLWGLVVLRGVKPPRPSVIRRMVSEVGDRANLVRRLERIEPFGVHFIYTDFSELVYACGKAKLVVIIDHCTKVALGWELSERAVTEAALEAWEMAKATLAELGYTPEEVIVHSDQDPVFTGYRWARELLFNAKARLSYALNGAKDNPEMESFFSRFKNENRSLFLDAQDIESVKKVVANRMRYYNRERRHSALGNVAPLVYVRGLKRK